MFFSRTLLVLSCLAFTCNVALTQDVEKPLRRPLKVALYPYVPEKAAMYWRVEQQFEDKHPGVDLRYVDLGAYYYSGQLMEAFQKSQADVIEVDTVFLRDLVDGELVQKLPDNLLPANTFFEYAQKAGVVNGETYGAPHWICGNFIYFRKDDPEYDRFKAIDSLEDLERILGRPSGSSSALMLDLRGSSTLGEKYLDALLDTYVDPVETLKRVDPCKLDQSALASLNRLFSLSPGGLCDSDKHHEFGQYYARQFGHRKARAMIGYSERMHFVVDHYLHGVREDEPAVGRIKWTWNDAIGRYVAHGFDDVDVVPATMSDKGSTMLSWVDALCIRKGVTGQTKNDAVAFIQFFNAEKLTAEVLTPEYGHAPRYLLPARLAVYEDKSLLQAAPLYARFRQVMHKGISLRGRKLNDKLRKIGKAIETAGFRPSNR